MKVEQIKYFRKYIEEARRMIIPSTDRNEELSTYFENSKKSFSNTKFENRYHLFEQELSENIKSYSDEMVMGYLNSLFADFQEWEGYDESLTGAIIREGDDVEFRISLMYKVEKVRESLDRLMERDADGNCPGLTAFRNSLLEKEWQQKVGENTPDHDERFSFKQLKNDIDKLSGALEKIKFITSRLFEFEQWRLQYDNLTDNDGVQTDYDYSSKLYPDFKELCELEIDKQKSLLDLEKLEEESYPEPEEDGAELDEDPLVWKAKSTHLIELAVALHECGAIGLKSEGLLTRKELLDRFQNFLNIEISDAESLLSRATERSTEKAPFISKLKHRFCAYCDNKQESKVRSLR